MAKIIPIGSQGYIKMDKIGSGGMCDVYLAKPIRGQGQVVIRELRETRYDDENRQNRKLFQNGVNAHLLLAETGSRFFPRFLGYSGTTSAIEHIDGRPLSEYGPQEERIVLALAYEMARCFEQFHGVKVGRKRPPVHRDPKPDNFLITEGEREPIVLLDFDFACINRTRDPVTGLWTRYSSPEQVEGRPVSPRSDLFSLGSTLYTLLTGEKPPHHIYQDNAFDVGTDRSGNRASMIPQKGDINPRTQIGQVILNCWRMNGEPYDTATQMKTDLQERMKRKRIPKDTRKVLALMDR